jgi:hypothetical protein
MTLTKSCPFSAGVIGACVQLLEVTCLYTLYGSCQIVISCICKESALTIIENMLNPSVTSVFNKIEIDETCMCKVLVSFRVLHDL